MAMAIPFLAALGSGGGAAAGAGAAAAGAAAGAGATVGAAGAAATSAALSASTAAGLATTAATIAAPTVAGTGITAAQVMGALSAVGAVGSAAATHQAGVAADQAARVAAKQEKDAAQGREIERRRALLVALASQNAAAGAQGVAFTGGKAAVARRDIKDSRDDLLRDTVNTQRNVRMLRLQGRNARAAGSLGAATSLLESGVKTYSNYG